MYRYLVLPILLVGTTIATAEQCRFGKDYGQVVKHFPSCVVGFPAKWKQSNIKNVQIKEAKSCIFADESVLLKNIYIGCCRIFEPTIETTNEWVSVASRCWVFWERPPFKPFAPGPTIP